MITPDEFWSSRAHMLKSSHRHWRFWRFFVGREAAVGRLELDPVQFDAGNGEDYLPHLSEREGPISRSLPIGNVGKGLLDQILPVAVLSSGSSHLFQRQ